MKLAKKTLSVALAAIMAASSFVGTISAFAAVDYYPASDPAFKAIAVGTTTVTPDVKFDTKYAAKKADLTDADKIAANIGKQIDATTLNNYYAFTPAKTGTYTINVVSTPVFEGYDKQAYDKLKDNKYLTEAEKLEASKKYATKVDGLYTDGTFATKLTDADAIDNVKIDNVAGKDAFVTAATTDSTVSSSTTKTLSWKYDATKKEVVVDKQYKDTTTGTDVKVVPAYLVAGKTYYFQVTVESFLTTVEEKDSKGDVYVKVAKSKAAPSAKVTIAMEQGETVTTNFKADTQKVEVPYDFAGGVYDSKTGKYTVDRDIFVPSKEVTYSGLATSYTVKDVIDGVKVTKFNNNNGSLTALTLGKNVETVTGCANDNLATVTIKNPNFVVKAGDFSAKATIVAPANSVAQYTAVKSGYKVSTTCTHKWTTVKAATIFAAGQRKCSECDKVEAIAKKAFAPTAKASGKKIVVKGNAGKVAKLAVWVYDANGKLVKKQVKKNVTKNTVKVAKAGKYTVKVKAYGTNGAKTASVKKTVKVK